jgi:GAF domain-containing protein/HD superfamily phosphohydrolase YqeK
MPWPARKLSLTHRFTIICFCGLITTALLMTYVFTQHNTAILRTSAETQNAAITRTLGNLILPHYGSFIAASGSLATEALRAHAATQAMRTAIANAVKQTNVTKVKIYDTRGRVVFSSSPHQIGADQSENSGVITALQGKVASELIYRNTFDAFEGTLEDRNLVSSYVPILDASGHVLAIFEIYSDVSDIVQKMEETRLRVLLVVGLPLSALFLILLGFIRKSDHLIESQRAVLEDSNTRLEQEVSVRTSELSARNQEFIQLLDIQQRMSQEIDLEALVPLAMREITRYIGADRSSLYLFDWKRMDLSAKFAEGVSGNQISIPLRMGIVGTAILNRRTYNVSNAYEHPFFNPTLDQVLNFRTESILVTPIINAAGDVTGGLQLLNRSTGRFSIVDESLVENTARQLAAADLDATFVHSVAHTLHQDIECDRVTVFKLDPAAGKLVSIYADGLQPGEIALGMNLGIAGLVAVTGQEILIDDAASDPRFDARFDQLTGYVTRSMMCLPIKARKGEVLGVAQVINKLDGIFGPKDVGVLRSLISTLSVFIENAMLFEDQDVQFHSMLEVMAASIDAKDTLTAGHSRHVADIAARIARELGFSDNELEVLKVAALLHDYGKIGIDDAVLKKEGKLTDDEYAHIKHHAQMTHSILDKIYFARKYRAVPLVAASHHEYLDGSGYPQGLTAKQIPFMSKILTVADVYEALTADRHYRKGMTNEKALAILREGAGRRFDENVIAALERTLAN